MASEQDDLRDRVVELERTLDDLRAELRQAEPRRRRPRLPSPLELLRFTESYTIPTVVAVLEATIKSLELLQNLLRLADPGRTVDYPDAPSTRLSNRSRALVERSLDELRSALTAADLPQDRATRELVEDALDLTTEIESRLDAASAAAEGGERDTSDEASPQVDVDAELKSIKEELRRAEGSGDERQEQ